MVTTSVLNVDDAQRVFDNIEHQFTLGNDSLIELTKAFLDEMKRGLANYNQPMAMIPSFVTGVPDGSEKGTFLALDLGGTNLRVCEVSLNGEKTFSLRQQKFRVSEALKTGEATALFDYLADSVDAFLTSNSPTDPTAANPFEQNIALNTNNDLDNIPDVLHLGLTFSFPVEQKALDSGKLLTWTKGFSAKNAVGKDVVQLLQDAFERKHMHVKCIALVNDTVGTLLTRAYTAGGCTLGAIFGTGTNGAYVEQVSNITKLGNSPVASKSGVMIINSEWGAFNNSRSHLPITPYDNALDRLSINPRLQAYEKIISGMYLGEITRHVLLSLVDAAPRPLVFGGKATHVMNAQWGLDSSVMSEIETAWEGDTASESLSDESRLPKLGEFEDRELKPSVRQRLERVRNVVVKSLEYEDEDVTLRDAAIVRWACMLVALRAARLSGVAVAAIMIQTGKATFLDHHQQETQVSSGTEQTITVGVDGSLIEHYPNFEQRLRESLRTIIGEDAERRIGIGMAKDGSGVGAALCALQALKQM